MNTVAQYVRAWLPAMLVLSCTCPRAAALIVVPPSTNANTSAPADDPGWLNVGDRGVYLGNRWVITAFHVGAGPTNFPGVGSFSAVPGSAMRIQNPAGQGLSQFTDLQVYRLSADPGLPWLSLSSTTPTVDAPVMLIGDGAAVTQSANETHWDVDESGGNAVWTEVPTGGDRHGYKATTFAKLWGTNLVEDDEPFYPMEQDDDNTVVENIGLGDVISFFTEFDKADLTDGLATESEAHGQSQDSGSAIFHKTGGGQWVLAGVTYAVSVDDGQPNPGLTAVFGNLTFAADLSAYRDQIVAITGIPEVGSFWLVGAAAGIAAAFRSSVRRREH